MNQSGRLGKLVFQDEAIQIIGLPFLCLVCEIPSHSYLCLVYKYIFCLFYYPPYFAKFISCLFIPLPSQTYCRLGKCQYLSQSIIIDTDKASMLQFKKHHCCNFFKASLLHLKMTTTMLYLFNNDALLYCQSIVIYK